MPPSANRVQLVTMWSSGPSSEDAFLPIYRFAGQGGPSWGSSVKSRRLKRVKRRLCCELVDGSERHAGLVMNIASNGMFVLTDATIPPGTQIEVEVPPDNDAPEMKLRAIVVRHRLVRGESSRLIPQGLGLRLLQAPDAYYELVKRADRSSSAPHSRFRHGLITYIRRMLSRGGATSPGPQGD